MKMPYTVRLAAFEGPMDLLLHLIEKNEMDIMDIPIASITAQYMEYLDTMRELDLEVTSDFLVMASTLLAIKARTLLPKPQPAEDGTEEEGPDPREELVQRLLEYKQFKEAALFLKDQQQVHGNVYTRPNNFEMYQHLIRPVEPLAGIDMPRLLEALQGVLKRVVHVEPPQVRAEEIRVQDKIAHVLRKMVLYPEGIPFSSAFTKSASRAEVIVTFLAILELLHMGQVALKQSEPFAEIIIKPAEGGNAEDDGIVS
jgi:segregation and condensation protein A